MIDKIPMQIPEQFLSRILNGELVRHGAILQDVASGQIVGHLKEAGKLGLVMSQLSMSPFGFVAEGANLISNGAQNIQLRKIQQTMGVLQVSSTIGAVASVASMGVSVVGFTVVMKRLKRVETKLDSVAGEIQSIRKVLNQCNLKWEAMTASKLTHASERLILAEEATTRKSDLLIEANSKFSELRHYFYILLSQLKPTFNADLNIAQVRELISRYFVAAMGQLHSEFLLNDLNAYRKTLSLIHEQSKTLTGFTVLDVFRNRSDSRPPLDINFDHKQLMDEVRGLKLYVTETVERIESSHVELEFLEQSHIAPVDYLEFLKNQESNLVLIPAQSTLEPFPIQNASEIS